MKKAELKKLIKPIVKECIHEVLLEEGLLSNVVAEVAKGMQKNVITETRTQPKPRRKPAPEMQMQEKANASREKMSAHRRKMMDPIGSDAYNGVNLFEGTEPLRSAGQPGAPSGPPSVLGEDSGDSGVDISSLMGNSSAIWEAMK